MTAEVFLAHEVLRACVAPLYEAFDTEADRTLATLATHALRERMLLLQTFNITDGGQGFLGAFERAMRTSEMVAQTMARLYVRDTGMLESLQIVLEYKDGDALPGDLVDVAMTIVVLGFILDADVDCCAEGDEDFCAEQVGHLVRLISEHGLDLR